MAFNKSNYSINVAMRWPFRVLLALLLFAMAITAILSGIDSLQIEQMSLSSCDDKLRLSGKVICNFGHQLLEILPESLQSIALGLFDLMSALILLAIAWMLVFRWPPKRAK